MAKFNPRAKWDRREVRRREREDALGASLDLFLGQGITHPSVSFEDKSLSEVFSKVYMKRLRSKIDGGFQTDEALSTCITSPQTASGMCSADDILKAASLMRENSNRRAAVLEKAFQGHFDQGEAELFFEKEQIDRLKCMTDELKIIIAEITSKFEGKLPNVVTTVGVYPNGPSNTNGVALKDLPYHIWYNLSWRPGRALIVNGELWYKGLGVAEEKLAEEIESYRDLVHIVSTAPYH